MWLVLVALRSQAPSLFEDITWKLIWNSSEECYSPDFGDVCRAHFDRGTLAALVFESEGRAGKESRMVVARKGRGTWRVTAGGRGSHAGGGSTNTAPMPSFNSARQCSASRRSRTMRAASRSMSLLFAGAPS
jgi:acetylornithine deacetylase/succinyl-diaminopimelate desuccinylase-like protein